MAKRKRGSKGLKRRRSTRGKRNVSRKRARRTRRGTGLATRRLVVSGSPVTVSTVATSNFWRYQTVSLDSGFQQMDVAGTTLVSLSNKTEYQALFDEYKLSAFKITLVPKYVNYSTDQAVALGTTLVPYVCIVKDPQSTLTPSGTWSNTTLNTLLENGGKIYRADRPVNIYMRPMVQEQYGSGATRHIRPRYTELASAAGTAMQHRGFHIYFFVGTWVPAQMAGLAWDVRVTYYLRFKNQK